MISTMFETIGEVITSFATALGDSITNITNIFVTSSGEGVYELTLVGTLLLIAVGIGLVYWAFRLVRRLVKMRG